MSRLLDQIKQLEGYSPKAFWDHKQYSIGYGTKASGPNERIDRAMALQRLQKRLAKDVARVKRFAPNAPQGTLEALASLSYNAGTGWMNKGLGRAVKSGNWNDAKRRFLQYNKASGRTNKGLVARRAKEASWFGAGSQPAVVGWRGISEPPQQSNANATIDPSQNMSVRNPASKPLFSSPAPKFSGGFSAPQSLSQGLSSAGSSIAQGMQKGGQMARLKQSLGLAPKPVGPMSVAPPAPMSTRPELTASNPHANGGMTADLIKRAVAAQKKPAIDPTGMAGAENSFSGKSLLGNAVNGNSGIKPIAPSATGMKFDPSKGYFAQWKKGRTYFG